MIELNETLPKYSLDKLKPDSEEAKAIFSKNLTLYQDRAQFWQPELDVAHKCMQYRRRNIFTPAQRKEYRSDGKIPVEPQEMKVVANAISDLTRKGVRSSKITYEDDTPPETAAPPEVVNSVLTHFETEMKIGRLKDEIRNDALITCFPNWIWFDRKYDITGTKEMIMAYHPRWDSMLPCQWFQSPDGKDIDDLIKISFVTDSDLYDMNPERYEEFKKYNPAKTWDESTDIAKESSGKSAYDRSTRILETIRAAEMDADQGYYMLLERFFQTRHERELYIREDPYDVVEMLSSWSPARKKAWEYNHPDYSVKLVDKGKCMWVSSMLSHGFVWENGEHWFQEDGHLPGMCYIPDMVDGMPEGLGKDMMPYIHTKAASDTEGLHQVRTGTGTTTHVVEGTTKHPGQVKNELNSQNGVIVHDEKKVRSFGGNVRNVINTEKRTPNTTFLEYSDKIRNEMNVATGINDAMRAITHPRQSDKAKQTDITQGMTTQGNYVLSYNNFELDLKNLLLKLIPYRYTEKEVIQINDNYGAQKEEQSVVVNQSAFNYSGDAEIVANDLTVIRYIAIPTLVDDSPTSKDRERSELIEILSGAGSALTQFPRIFAVVLLSLENRFAKEIGGQIMEFAEQSEQQQQQQQQIELQKEMAVEEGRRAVDWAKLDKTKKALNVKMDAEDVQKNTVGAKALLEIFNR